jgi:Protein of unknown function (DUF3047)
MLACRAMFFLRRYFPLAAAAAILSAGCATTSEDGVQDDGLLASTTVVRRMQPASGNLLQVGRFSTLKPGDGLGDQWEPYTLQPADPPTLYRPVQMEGHVCIEADATNGHSAMQRLIRIDPERHPILEWSWRVPRLESDASAPSGRKASPRARLMLAFHGDPEKLDFEQRVQMRMAKAITGQAMPYSSLIYVWLKGVPEGTVVLSPYSDRVRLMAMDSSDANLDRWVDFRRDVREDYRRAFGEEPGDIVGVGIYTDVDNNGAPGRAYYGDISFHSGRSKTARQSSVTE